MSNADIYHEMIIDYSRNPLNFGEIENPDVTYHDSNPLWHAHQYSLKLQKEKILKK